MKKLLALLVIGILFSACGTKEDPLKNSFIIDNQKLQKDIIKSNLNLFLIQYDRKWSKTNKNKVVNALYYGEKEFNIDHKIVLSIIAIESRFNITAKGYNSGSIDYGLTQQNSKYIKQRYEASKKYLDKYNLKYSDTIFDINQNIFSCYIYLNEIDKSSLVNSFNQMIKAYNVGIKGSTLKDWRQPIADRYYEKFAMNYIRI